MTILLSFSLHLLAVSLPNDAGPSRDMIAQPGDAQMLAQTEPTKDTLVELPTTNDDRWADDVA